jgi:hypothetical protein
MQSENETFECAANKGVVYDGLEVPIGLGPQRHNLITNQRVEIKTEGGMKRKRRIKL